MPETGCALHAPRTRRDGGVRIHAHRRRVRRELGPVHADNGADYGRDQHGIFSFFGLWSLWWNLRARPWGYGLAALFGLFFGVAEIWHLVDDSNMTPFRWTVVLLAQASAAVVVVLGAKGLWRHRPWRRSE